MPLNEFEVVALTLDFPKLGLREGDLGTIVDVIKGGEAYFVEFVDSKGYTVALEIFLDGQIRALQPGEHLLRRAMAA